MSLKIGIVSAMQREVGPLTRVWQQGKLDDAQRTYSLWRCNTATYIQSGIGRGPALLATRALVDIERPDILISAGFAGALTRSLAVGDLITPGTVIDADTGQSFAVHPGTGVLVTSAAIADERQKSCLASKFCADAVDMEAAAVALVAGQNGIPFCALKAVSDEVDFPMPPFNEYVDEEGHLARERFAAHVAFRPAYWPALMQLARNSKRAAEELSSALALLLESLGKSEVVSNLELALRGIGALARGVN